MKNRRGEPLAQQQRLHRRRWFLDPQTAEFWMSRTEGISEYSPRYRRCKIRKLTASWADRSVGEQKTPSPASLTQDFFIMELVRGADGHCRI